MSGKIDAQGSLYLHRNGTLRPQCCPQHTDIACGDWFPFFGELNGQTLRICRDTLLTGIVEGRPFGGDSRAAGKQGKGEHDPDEQRGRHSREHKEDGRKNNGRKKGETYKIKRWLKKHGDLVCPECGTIKKWKADNKYQPRSCRGCGVHLAQPEE